MLFPFLISLSHLSLMNNNSSHVYNSTNIPNSGMSLLFKNYVETYNKIYSHSEYEYRYEIFTNNYNYIIDQNNKVNYTLGINNFTDFSREEFKKYYLSGISSYSRDRLTNFLYHNTSNNTLPSSIDWRAAGIVTNVKDQGQCGSCWAFSTTGTVEGQHALAYDNLISLSEQNLVDCSTRNYGCGGGWPTIAMDYIRQNGVDTERSYSYIANDEPCKFNKTNVGSYLNNVVMIPGGNMTSLYSAIGLVGPISIAIDAEDDFQFYKSGIYSSSLCSNDRYSLNHAVLAVGYSNFNNTNFIIVKNSWGSDWGMDGYIYMSTEIDNMCGMATNASYPLINRY